MKPVAARTQTTYRFAGQIMLINLAATVAAITLGVFSMGWTRAISLENVFGCFAHSFSIGSLIGSAVVFVAPRMVGDSTFARWLKMTAIIFFATFVGVTVANAFLSLAGYSDWASVFPPRVENLFFSLVIAFLFGFSSFFYEISQTRLAAIREKLRRTELDEAQARSLAAEAQIASLESRIHPHFLFNTLNSIAALIRENPVLAENMVERLAKLLRYSLDANSQSLIALEQELRITGNYLEIEKVRFGARLHYRIADVNGFGQTKLPPLALQTLVENSIKHVAAKSSNRTEISVETIKNGDSLEINVRDNGAGFSESNLTENHGLDTLRKRLTAIFGSRAALEIAGDETGCVRLKIPLQAFETINE